MRILDFSIERAGNVAALAIAALLSNEVEKLRKSLFIASLEAKDIGEQLAPDNPLQMIVENRHITCQPAFEREGAQNPSEKAVKRAKR